MESTIREWMADRRGRAVFGPIYGQMEARSRKMFGGDGEGRYGDDSSIGMDIMEMFSDMPLVSVLMFQPDEYPKHPEDLVAGMLQQVHNME